MARLGELLVHTQLLTSEQVEQGLRAQVMWGGRLGTNLIELGYLDLDQLSSALGKQQKMPAALARHFEKADPALQRKLSTEFAERYAVVPLMKVATGKIVIASIGTVEKRGMAIVADELETDVALLVLSVAAELRIRYHLERAYKIPRGARFMRSRGKTIPPFPQFEADALSFEDSAVTSVPAEQRERLEEMHDDALAPSTAATTPAIPPPIPTPKPPIPVPDPTPPPIAKPPPIPETVSQIDVPIPIADGYDTTKTEAPDMRADAVVPPSSPGLTLDSLTPAPDDLEVPVADAASGDAATGGASGAASGGADEEARGRERRQYLRMITDEPPSTDSERSKLGRIAIRKVAITATPTNLTLGEATRAIRRSTDRDKVADLVLVMLEKFLPSCEAAILLVLRGDVAIGWRGYCRGGAAIPEVAIPLEKPGLIPTAIQSGASVRSPSTDLGEIDRLLLSSLRCNLDEVGRELVVVPVTIAAQSMLTIALVMPPDTDIASAESIAAATGAAFARLMRHASR